MKIRTLACVALLLGVSSGAVANTVEVIPLQGQDSAVEAERLVPMLQPFQVQYQAMYSVGFFTLDVRAVRKLVALDANRWKLTFEAKTTGASLTETSIFTLQDGVIVPQDYQFSAGGLLNKESEHQRFWADKQEVEDVRHGKHYSDIWQDGLQDNLTYILQASLDLAQGKTELDYYFFQNDQIKHYQYKLVAEEIIKTRVGPLKTVKLERINDSKQRKIFAWFAVDHQYQLVRLAEIKKGKTTYQIDVGRF